MNPTDDQLRKMTRDQLRVRASRLLQRLYDRPREPREKALEKVKQVIAGKLARAGVRLGRRGCCRFPDGAALLVDTREYEPYIYRLHIGIPIWYGRSLLGMNRLSELSFIEPDLAHLDGNDLAEFLARLSRASKDDNWQATDEFNWPLFSHDESYPTYAWTKAANAFYEERHKERLRYEKELARRRGQLLTDAPA